MSGLTDRPPFLLIAVIEGADIGRLLHDHQQPGGDSRRLRLVAYSDAMEMGGAEHSLATLLANLDPRIEVTVMGTQPEVVRRLAQSRPASSTRCVPAVHNKADLRAIVTHVRAMRAIQPDIVHVNLRHPWSCQYGLVAGLVVPGARVVAVEHLPLPAADRLQRRLKRVVCSRLAAHVAVGRRAARIVEELGNLPYGSVRTIHNGVPDLQAPAERSSGSGPRVVASMGRLVGQKGFDVLVRALALLPDVACTIVGDGPERARLTRLAADLGVGDRLTITGWVDEPRRLLGSFDVFVLASRFEGFPLSIVEAMLAGLPVVATDVGSVAESVVPGRTGLLVPPDDPDALAEAISGLMADAPLRARLGTEGRRLASECFTATTMARAFEQLYGEVTAAPVASRWRSG